MMPILPLGPLAVPMPAILIILGVWSGLSLAERHAARRGVNPDMVFNLALVAIMAGVVGGRLAYAARFIAAFTSHPLDLFSRNLGLFDAGGGLLAAMICAAIYAQHKHMPLFTTLDAITPALAVIMIAIGLANLASGEAYGRVTSLPWGIDLWGEKRHPAQIYGSLAAIVILWRLWPAQAAQKYPQPGIYFLVFIAHSAAAGLFLEFFRADSQLIPGGFRSTQVIAWLILAASLCAIQAFTRRHIRTPRMDQG